MKAVELRKKTVDKLNEELISLLKEQFDLRMKRASDQLTQNHLLQQVRRNIARIKTVLNDRATGEKNDKG